MVGRLLFYDWCLFSTSKGILMSFSWDLYIRNHFFTRNSPHLSNNSLKLYLQAIFVFLYVDHNYLTFLFQLHDRGLKPWGEAFVVMRIKVSTLLETEQIFLKIQRPWLAYNLKKIDNLVSDRVRFTGNGSLIYTHVHNWSICWVFDSSWWCHYC